MTHDLFASMSQAFGIVLKEVFIHRFEDGIFSSELTFVDPAGQEVILDARTSDAIAIAMRTGSPIFTTRQILAETGFIMEVKDADESTATEDTMADDDLEAAMPAPAPRTWPSRNSSAPSPDISRTRSMKRPQRSRPSSTARKTSSNISRIP